MQEETIKDNATVNKLNKCSVSNPCATGVGGFITLLVMGILLAHYVFGLSVWPLSPRRYITVTGYYEYQQGNEVASYTASVSSKNKDKEMAVKETTEKSQTIIDSMKAFGIDEKDLKTQSINIYQDQDTYYENGVQKYRGGDWNASISIEITLRQIDRANELTERLTALDISNLWGPNFAIDRSGTDEGVMLTKAYENAKVKADAMALGVGKKVGKVVNITEGINGTGPITPYMDRGFGGGGGGIEAGSSTVSTTITVTFELN